MFQIILQCLSTMKYISSLQWMASVVCVLLMIHPFVNKQTYFRAKQDTKFSEFLQLTTAFYSPSDGQNITVS